MSILGLECKAYFGSVNLAGDEPANVESGITWTELSNLRDTTTNLEKALADISTRATQGFRAQRGTLKEGTLEFEMVWEPGDEGFEAIKDAFFGNTLVALMFLDGDKDTAGSQGLVANFDVTNFSRPEPLEDAVKVNVTVVVSSYPQWYVKGT